MSDAEAEPPPAEPEAEPVPGTPDAKFPPVAAEDSPDPSAGALAPSGTEASCYGNSVAGTPPLAGTRSSVETLPLGDTPGEAEAGPDPIAFERMMAVLAEGPTALSNLTPRTKEACAKEGIEPRELLPKKVSDFAGAASSPIAERFQRSRHARYEANRAMKVRDVLTARESVTHAELETADQAAMRQLQDELHEARARYADEEAAAHHRKEYMKSEATRRREEIDSKMAASNEEFKARMLALDTRRKEEAAAQAEYEREQTRVRKKAIAKRCARCAPRVACLNGRSRGRGRLVALACPPPPAEGCHRPLAYPPTSLSTTPQPSTTTTPQPSTPPYLNPPHHHI